MADHVGVGEIDHQQVVAHGFDAVQRGLQNAGGAHLRLQVIGRHLRRGNKNTVLALCHGFIAPVQEKGDMRIFLGLGKAQLATPGLGDRRAKGAADLLRAEQDLHLPVEPRRIGCHGDATGERDRLRRETRLFRI